MGSSWLFVLLSYLKRMGCVLMRQSLTVQGEKYTIKKKLAEGGFSNIDLAENSRNKKLVALKRITCHSIQDQNNANFEIEIHRKFQHENLIQLLGSSLEGEADIVNNKTSEAVLVLPYYPKGSLQDELDRRSAASSPFDQRTVLQIFSGVCAGLRVMHYHEPPYAHRDIKPHNVLLEKDYTPVLMDLGSVAVARSNIRTSRDAQFLQDTAAERCSITYRPPELFVVEPHGTISEKTDIWSLGCLLFALMYYKSPFDSVYERGDSVALAVQNRTVVFPAEEGDSRKHFSPELRDLVLKLLNLDINFRPSLDNVIEDVESMLNSSGDHLVLQVD